MAAFTYMRRVIAVGMLAQFATGSALAGGCTEPPAVTELPNGATASRDEMLSAQRAMKVYDNAVKAYSDCLHEAGDTSNRANIAVDRLQRMAERFNAELHAFKERNGAG
jgi:hypothetical protein